MAEFTVLPFLLVSLYVGTILEHFPATNIFSRTRLNPTILQKYYVKLGGLATDDTVTLPFELFPPCLDDDYELTAAECIAMATTQLQVVHNCPVLNATYTDTVTVMPGDNRRFLWQ